MPVAAHHDQTGEVRWNYFQNRKSDMYFYQRKTHSLTRIYRFRYQYITTVRVMVLVMIVSCNKYCRLLIAGDGCL